MDSKKRRRSHKVQRKLVQLMATRFGDNWMEDCRDGLEQQGRIASWICFSDEPRKLTNHTPQLLARMVKPAREFLSQHPELRWSAIHGTVNGTKS